MIPISDFMKRYEEVNAFAVSDMYARNKTGESILDAIPNPLSIDYMNAFNDAIPHPLLGSDYMNAFNDMYRAITGQDFVRETDTEDDIVYLLITTFNFVRDSMKLIVSHN